MADARHALTPLGLPLLALMLAPGVGAGACAQARDTLADGLAARPAGLDLYLPAPPGALRPEAVALGRRLFFDPLLSRDSSLSCSTRHRPDRAFTDGRARPVGVDGQTGRRNAPTLVNRGWGRVFFWDGRASTLEAQALEPIRSPAELNLPVDDAVARVASRLDYVRAFRDVFGRDPAADLLARALGSYLRSIRAGDSPFDRFAAGDTAALDTLERQGLALFQGRARCDRCHTGPLLSDERFHNTGVAWRDGPPDDAGRAEVSGEPADRGSFKTPTLREVAGTAPYMHDGSLTTLEEVVAFYDRGGVANPNLDPRIRPLDLTAQEKRALVAFLRSLSGRIIEGR